MKLQVCKCKYLYKYTCVYESVDISVYIYTLVQTHVRRVYVARA